MPERCQACTRFKPTKYGGNHTVRCEKEPGHDGGHEWKKDGRTVTWYGAVNELPSDTRWLYGLRPGWLNE